MFIPSHPGKILKNNYVEYLKNEAGLTVEGFADLLGVSRQAFSNLINEKSGISTEMAVRLSMVLGTTAESWINLQKNYDLAIETENFAKKDKDNLRKAHHTFMDYKKKADIQAAA